MSFNVDVEEADVAVLNQNLIRSKELFNSISKSLNKISTKSSTASSKIKPILKDVNKLNSNKKQIENGLELLQEVSRYAEMTTSYESIMNNSIELIGLKKFIDSLTKSRLLLKEMKSKIKNFKGILINFESMIDKSELKLQSYFQKILMDSNNKIHDICMIMKYFEKDLSYMNKIYIRIRSNKLIESVKQFESITIKNNIPYERGMNGINKFNSELIKNINKEVALIDTIKNSNIRLNENLLKNILDQVLNEDYSEILNKYYKFLNTNTIINNEILMLELIENLIVFEESLNEKSLIFSNFSKFNESFNSLIANLSVIFKELFRLIENKISAIEKFSEINIPEFTVELISKIRKVSEFHKSLLRLISGYKVGDWLSIKPPVRFINIYTSVIPNIGEGVNESSPEYLLSCFYSDILDSIMINIEIELKSDLSIKKSTQGFYLIKNLIMIETIINRSQQLFNSLGNLGIERINKLKNRFLKLFLDDWNYASYIIIRDMTSIATTNAQSGHHSGGLSNKEREQVKELFKNFNESFEEALRNYEKYNITDVNLRNYLSNEIKKLILNAYFKLFDKYGKSDFTKNKSKYIRYDKQQFEGLLNDKL